MVRIHTHILINSRTIQSNTHTYTIFIHYTTLHTHILHIPHIHSYIHIHYTHTLLRTLHYTIHTPNLSGISLRCAVLEESKPPTTSTKSTGSYIYTCEGGGMVGVSKW